MMVPRQPSTLSKHQHGRQLRPRSRIARDPLPPLAHALLIPPPPYPRRHPQKKYDAGVPDSLGTVELQNEAVTVRRYKTWTDAYTDGVLSMVPPGKKLDMGTDLGIKAPPSAPAAAPAEPKPEKKAPRPKRTSVEVKTYDSWQAAFLDGYGFPAAGQKLPKKPEPKADNATAAEAPKALLPPEDAGNATTVANATTASANDTAVPEIPKVAKAGARRLLTPREMI